MDTKSLTKLIMNPVRLRITQYLMTYKEGTAGEIRKALSDVPQASLYRHIKKLYDAGLIEVIKETTVRGTIEKTYSLVENPIKETPTNKDIGDAIFYTLMSLQSSFANYFDKSDVNPQKDLLLVQTSTLMLNDEEFMEMLGKMGNVISEYVELPPGNGRKSRRFTVVSSPNEEI